MEVLLHPLGLSGLCIFGFMCTMFVVALILKKNSIVDSAWGVGFIIVCTVTLLQNKGENYPAKQTLMMFIVALWGLRLASYIAIRSWGKPEDFRYAQWRKQWGKNVVWRSFLQVFMLQGIIMFIISLPIIVVNSTPHTTWGGSLYPIGAVIWLIGFICESVADHQMFFFKEKKSNHGRVMHHGLWKYSRHPNYFGETLVWWGIYIVSIPSGYWYITIISPVVITFLLLKVSGVTLLEKKYDGNDEYALYKQKTNAFIPWLPKK